jgi:hypothetical protein
MASLQLYPFEAGDGFACNLLRAARATAAPRGPVLLVHGAGVSAQIFMPPTPKTLVDCLLEAGYDVWLENWRASIDFAPNEYTLDHAALYDHPAAVATIVRETGAATVKAVIHCQGSTSFMMAAVAGLLPQVDTIVSNAVSLHPVVSGFSTFKIRCVLPLLAPFTRYLNPQWGEHAPSLFARLIRLVVNLTHHECDNPVCKQVSFTYGTGFPALWRHENLSAATHDWIRHQFAHVPLSFYRQMRRCLRARHLVSVLPGQGLPGSFVGQPPRTRARMAFFAGRLNQCFLAESQWRTFKYFNQLRPGFHTLHVLDDYSHLDVFLGKDAARDVFPLMIQALNQPA